LIATAPEGRRVGFGIRGVKHGAIDGHESIAPKEGTRHGRGLGDHLAALAHESLQALAAQGLASSTESRIAHASLRLSGMQITESSHQLLPHLALVQTAPQRHAQHKEHQAQGRTGAHPPCFAGPGLTLLDTALDHFLGIHFTEHRQAHLFTHLVIDLHLA
jgi:hypothetical protein